MPRLRPALAPDFSSFASDQPAETLQQEQATAAAPDFSDLASDTPPVKQTLGGNYREFIKGFLPGAIQTVTSAAKGLAALNLPEPTLRAIDPYVEELKRVPAMSPADLDAFQRRVDQEVSPPIRQTVSGILQSLREGTSKPADLGDVVRRPAEDLDVRNTALYQLGQAAEEFGRNLAPADPGYEESPGRILGEGLGSVAAGIAGALASPAIAGLLFTASGSGQAADQAIEAGASPEQVAAAAQKGTVPGATDVLPVEVLLSGLKIPKALQKPILNFVAKVGVQVFVEGVQEGGQQFLQNVIARQTYAPEQDLAEGIVPNAAAGGGVGGVASIVEQVAEAALGGRRAGHARPGRPEAPAAHGAPDFSDAASERPPEAPATVPEGAQSADVLYPEPEDEAAAESPAAAATPVQEAPAVPVAAEPPRHPVDVEKAMARYRELLAGIDAAPEIKADLEREFREIVESDAAAAKAKADAQIVAPQATDGSADADAERIEAADAAIRAEMPAEETGSPADPVTGEAEGPDFSAEGVPAGSRAAPIAVETAADIEAAAPNAATEPSDAQKEAGNYRKAHVRVHGLDVTIENPKGSTRSGTAPNGEPWSVVMPGHYGYVKRTKGADGDQVDVYIGDHPESDHVFVVDQNDAATGQFDEHKAILGASDEAEAQRLYEAGFSDGKGKERIGGITEMSVEEFRSWVTSGDTTKPLASPTAEQAELYGKPVQQEVPPVEPAIPVRDVMRSKAWKTAFKDNEFGKPHPESHAAAEMVSGWLDAKTDKAPQKPRPYNAKSGGDPVSTYLMGYIAAKEGKARTVRASEAEAAWEVLTRPPAATAEEEPAAAPTTGSEAKTAPTEPAKGEKFREIGKNLDGQTIFEDKNGVRSRVENGVRITEPVAMRPTRAGVERSIRHSGEWMTEPERTAEGEAPTWAEVLAALPKDAADRPDIDLAQRLMFEVSGSRTAGFGDLSASQRAELLARATAESGQKAVSGASTPQETTDEPDSGVSESAPAVPPEEPAGDVRHAPEERRAPAAPPGRRGSGSEPGGTPDSADARADQRGSGPAAELPAQSAGDGSDSARGGRDRSNEPDLSAAPADSVAEVETVREERTARNYRITADDAIGQGGPKAKVRANIEAIRTLKTIEEEKREATDDEKRVLVRYVGWGAFAQDVFAEHKAEWSAERAALKDALTADEYKAARASTLNAHYTSEAVIRGAWKAVEHLGFAKGRALEPSAGVGHFIGLQPGPLADRTTWSAVELDSITGRIAKTLYAASDVNVMGFEKFDRPDDFYDLAISNVPFGSYSLRDTRYPGGHLIHDYFFIKSLDKVRPGGVVAFITSSGTMDKAGDRARREIDARAELLGAIRLPGGKKGAFAGNAGTEVTTDIIFLRKRIPGAASELGQAWNKLATIETPDGAAEINEYFVAHPEMMLGEMRLTGTMYVAREPVLIGDSTDLEARISAAAERGLPAKVVTDAQTRAFVEPETITAGSEVKAGAFFVEGGKVFRKLNGVGVEQPLSAADRARVTALVDLRSTLNQLLARPDDPLPLRAALNRQYDRFVKKHGPIGRVITTITRRTNRAGEAVVIRRLPNFNAFRDDPDAFKVLALEHYDEASDRATKAAIFTEDVFGPSPEPQIRSGADAIAVSLDRYGRILPAAIGEMLGKTPKDAMAELGDSVFLDPNGDVWRTRDDYLSGDVVTKLEEARAAAKTDRAYAANVAALEKVQPAPLTRSDITAKMGAPWVPAGDYEAFIASELGGQRVSLSRNRLTHTWVVSRHPQFSREAQATYGTDRVSVEATLTAALNNQQMRVTYKDADGKEILDHEATEQARIKVQAIRDAFSGDPEQGIEGWVWKDDERAARLEEIYNRTFNRYVPQKIDGSHLTFPGLAKSIARGNGDVIPFALRPHQKDAVWRVIQRGNTLLDHVVGAGKTFTMIAAGMEQKRLGLIRRPMFAVPNHMLEQFSREFLQAYPGANILVADKDSMSASKRKEFAGRIAAEKWDGIVITHDAFGRIGMSTDFVADFMQQEIDEYVDAINAATMDSGKRSATVKQLEAGKKRLEARLQELVNEERKDEGATFEELGVDQVFVDEAHLFKNLSIVTKMTRIKGLGQGNAQRATDLYMKIRYLEGQRRGRSAVFATGTPISNTIAEMYTMQRYLQLDALKAEGIERFDAWAATFGEVVTRMELGADGRTFQETSSFSRFVNIPELVSLFSQVADSRTAEMLNLPRPQLAKRPDGTRGIFVVEAEPSGAEERYIARLVQRAAEVKGKRAEKGADNMLKIVSEGRKVATDYRLLFPDARINPDGKTARAVAKIHEVWQRTGPRRSTQIVFLDMGTPTSTRARAAPKAAPDELTVSTMVDDDGNIVSQMEDSDVNETKFNLYEDIRQRLVAAGVPKAEIAFIHEANDDAKKARLFDKVRRGTVRILIGSTAKMGVGTNVQDKLIALHHIDAPWKPAEVTQRDGRGLRQGNENPEIEIYRYVTRRSFDSFMWQTLERKAGFIAQLQAGARGVRTMEDVDDPLPEAAQLKAAASGDPRIIEHAELSKTVRDLEAQRRAHERTIYDSRRALSDAVSSQQRLSAALEARTPDADKVTDVAGDKFVVDLSAIGGSAKATERKKAGLTIIRHLEAAARNVWGSKENPTELKVGTLSGFDMVMSTFRADNGVVMVAEIKGGDTYVSPEEKLFTPEADPVGIVRRFENLLGYVRAIHRQTAERLDAVNKSIPRLRELSKKTPFPREAQYRAAKERLDTLTSELKPKKSGEDGSAVRLGSTISRSRPVPDFSEWPLGKASTWIARRLNAVKSGQGMNYERLSGDRLSRSRYYRLADSGEEIRISDHSNHARSEYLIDLVVDGDGLAVLYGKGRDYIEFSRDASKPEHDIAGDPIENFRYFDGDGVAWSKAIMLAIEEAAGAGETPQRPPPPALSEREDQGPPSSGPSDSGQALGNTAMRRPTFYSAALRAAEGAKITKGTPGQWLATIRNTPGVKQEELNWIGLDDWLRAQTGSITRDQVSDFIRANQIQVRDVVKADDDATDAASRDVLRQNLQRENPDLPDDIIDEMVDEMSAAGHTTSLYREYQLPGGENYRELLLTLPPRTSPQGNAVAAFATSMRGKYGERWLTLATDDERATYDRLIDQQEALPDEPERGNFRSPHFEEPNVLAHVRFNDRTDADGKRTLFVEEIQSDWHQAGRKKGYRQAISAEHRRELEAEAAGLLAKVHAMQDSRTDYADREHRVWNPEYLALQDRRSEIDRELDANSDRVPDAPFKTTWPELALKRMVRWAAENGYDQVAWTPGVEQVKRYATSLRQAVKAIRWAPSEGRTKTVHIAPSIGRDLILQIDDRGVVQNTGSINGEEKAWIGLPIEDVVGKDAAARIADERSGKIEGQGLTIGGKGMTDFYDKMLVSIGNKIGKKFGAKVGEAHVAAAPGVSDQDLEQIVRYGEPNPAVATVHALPITDAMRDAAMQGQPLFKRTERSPLSRPSRLTAEQREALDQLVTEKVHHIFGKDVTLHLEAVIPIHENLGDAEYRAAMRDYAEAGGQATLGDTAGGEALLYDTREAVIRLAMEDPAFTPMGSARHEAYHAVEALLMTDAEFAPLLNSENAAKARIAAALELKLDPNSPAARALPSFEARAIAFERYDRLRDNGMPIHLTGIPRPLALFFEKLRRLLAEIRKWLTGKGYTRLEDVFEDVRQGRMRDRERTYRAITDFLSDEELSRDQGGAPNGMNVSDARRLGSIIAHGGDGPFVHDGADARRKAMQHGFEFAPIDRAIRLPFDIFGGLNQKGEWQPGVRLSQKAADVITGAKFSDQSRFAWMNGALHRARAGLVDRYGLSPEYVARDRQRTLEERATLAEVPEILKTLQSAGIGSAEARVLQGILTGEETPTEVWAQISEPIRNAIDQFGQEAVELGLVSAESFERNRGTYLHRVYLKHELDQSGLARFVSEALGRRRKKIIGNELKGRGLFKTVARDKLVGMDEDTPAVGTKYQILDRVAESGKVTKRVYVKAGTPTPKAYQGYESRGFWEVRGVQRGEIVLWRDYTKAERIRMGEITDARYTIAKTYMLMAHDLSVGRFYRDIAGNRDWATAIEPNETWKEAGDYKWADPAVEWVHVPADKIPKSSARRYGALADKWVRAEIWRDLAEVEHLNRSNLWSALLTQWKLNKTARSPVVHMNNVMSNFVLMDMSGVGLSDLAAGIRSMAAGDALYQEAHAHGAFGADMATQEIRRNVLEPLLKGIEKDVQGGMGTLEARLGLIGRLADAVWSAAKFVDSKMIDLYRVEDEVFRMALYARRRAQGIEAQEAADEARQQFIDYDIRAPWVNTARRTVLPFISYSYRAVPLVARTIMVRPWKLAKYAAVAYAVNALAYLLLPGDEDEERRSMRDEVQGYTWIGAPRMLRMPFADSYGNPTFLDIRRWMPAGDVFDTSQGSSAIGIPAPLQFGGPLAMGAELALNKQAFTGNPIVNDLTDDWWDRTAKISDWAYKSWMPSAAYVPGSWYWEKVGNAIRGARDWQGKPYDVGNALLSSIGVKVQPQDVQEGFRIWGIQFNRVERELKSEMGRISRDHARGMTSNAEYERQRQRVIDKLTRLAERQKLTFTGQK